MLQQACFPEEIEASGMDEGGNPSGQPASAGIVNGQCASAGAQPAITGEPAAAPTDSHPSAAGPANASSSPSNLCLRAASVAIAPAPTHSQELVRKTLTWATGTKDAAVIASLADSLPDWAIAEQVQKYKDAQLALKMNKQVQKIRVNPSNRWSKINVGKAFAKHLDLHQVPHPSPLAMRSASAITDSISRKGAIYWKAPEAVWASFMSQLTWPKKLEGKQGYQRKLVRRWYDATLSSCGGTLVPATDEAVEDKRAVGGRGQKQAISGKKRMRTAGSCGVHLIKAPSIRKRLYEWFLSVRYSIDWDAINKRARNNGRKKAMGRFPRAILKAKVQQFQLEYAEESLKRGVKVSLFTPRSRWFSEWEKEYGLCMKQPNRKYKCSKELLGQRLQAFWITVFRIRAFILALFGYDPDMENFDQTPYHKNESGSQDARTLAVAGEKVPLIEGHGDTRVRWTANLTTFSDAARIERGERPYCEFMFKHDIKGEVSQLELRLREHIRGRGYGPWVTVATSHSGSYSQDDVVNFLDAHLPRDGPQSRARYWRIMFADDFAAHKVDAVRRLCWQRGYVLIIQPGGATPVTQTCDTDLNQTVRREYIVLETQEFIAQFQQGVAIPSLRPEMMIDLMVEVLSGPEIHLAAAAGYKKTGVKVKLEGGEDQEIQREAGDFWRELGMREKVNKEIKLVREAAEQGHLTWSYHNVLHLMMPYPKNVEEDRLLRLTHDAGHVDDEEARWARACGDEVPGEDDSSTESESDDAGANAGAGAPSMAGCNGGPASAMTDLCPQSGTAAPELSADLATAFEDCHHHMTTLHAVHQELRACGLMKQAHGIQLAIDKQRRHMRALGREDADVAIALRDRQREVEAQHQLAARRVEDAYRMNLTAKRIKAQVAEAGAELKRKHAALKDVEDALALRHAMKTFTPELLGQGQKRAGGAKAQKVRFEVLDRLASYGVGLSPDQKNDWSLFKHAWDSKMVDEHDVNWGSTFAGWVQQIVEDMASGKGNNAFSMFMHNEWRRCLSDEPAIRLPGRQ